MVAAARSGHVGSLVPESTVTLSPGSGSKLSRAGTQGPGHDLRLQPVRPLPVPRCVARPFAGPSKHALVGKAAPCSLQETRSRNRRLANRWGCRDIPCEPAAGAGDDLPLRPRSSVRERRRPAVSRCLDGSCLDEPHERLLGVQAGPRQRIERSGGPFEGVRHAPVESALGSLKAELVHRPRFGYAARPRRRSSTASPPSATGSAAIRAAAAARPGRQGSTWPPRWPHSEYQPEGQPSASP